MGKREKKANLDVRNFVGVQSCKAPEPAPIIVLRLLQHDHDTDVDLHVFKRNPGCCV